MNFVIFVTCLLICAANFEQIPEQGYTWTPTENGTIDLQTDEGYFISATVLKCKLDGENGDYFEITSSGIIDDGLRFSYTVPKNYTILISTDSATANLISSNFTDSELSVFFKRAGEPPTTTTEPPTTDVTFPTPSNESRLLTVFLKNNPNDFTDTIKLNTLKTAIMGMATEYCSIAGFVLIEVITLKNILIERLTRCPNEWENSDVCSEITFAVPVYIDSVSSKWKGYQLKTEHLRIMWDTLADKYLGDFEIYDIPDVNKLNLVWYLSVGLLVAVFLFILILLRWMVLKMFASKRKTRRASDTDIFEAGDTRKSHGLRPHYMQETPQLFDNMNYPDNDLFEDVDYRGFENPNYQEDNEADA